MNSNPWIEHFKRSVGKTYMWGDNPGLVVLKNKSGNGTVSASKELPVNVITPVEQVADMAKAEASGKTGAKYRAPSVAGKSSNGEGKKKRKKKKKSSKGKKSGKRKTSGKKTKKRKRGEDIFD